MNGKVLIMNGESDSSRKVLTVLLLIVGFSSALGWMGMTFVGIPLVFSVLLLIFAVVCLPWAFALLKKIGRKRRLVVPSLVLSVVLSPLCFAMGITFIVSVPFAWGLIAGTNIVQSATSPDGEFEAYVEAHPSIDPPNQSLYIQRRDVIHFKYIAQLAEDIDSIREIQWSPHSDIVVFITYHNLIAVHVPRYQIVKIPLGKEWVRSKKSKRSTFASRGPRYRVEAVEFPEPGIFRYRLENTEGFQMTKTVNMGLI